MSYGSFQNFSVTAGGSSFVITSNGPFKIPAGIFFTITSDTKLYVVTETAIGAWNGSTFSATVKVGPKFRYTNNSVSINFNPKATVFNEPDNSSLAYTDGILQNISLKFIEAI